MFYQICGLKLTKVQPTDDVLLFGECYILLIPVTIARSLIYPPEGRMATTQTTKRINIGSIVSLIAGIFPWLLWLTWLITFFSGINDMHHESRLFYDIYLYFLVFYPLAVAIIAIVIGIVSLVRIRKADESGKGFALAGLILGIIDAIAWFPWCMLIAISEGFSS